MQHPRTQHQPQTHTTPTHTTQGGALPALCHDDVTILYDDVTQGGALMM
jgi:hypothetical protein